MSSLKKGVDHFFVLGQKTPFDPRGLLLKLEDLRAFLCNPCTYLHTRGGAEECMHDTAGSGMQCFRLVTLFFFFFFFGAVIPFRGRFKKHSPTPVPNYRIPIKFISDFRGGREEGRRSIALEYPYFVISYFEES